MVDFSLSYEQDQIRQTVRTFVERELIPLEDQVLRNDRAGLDALPREVIQELQAKGRKNGLWGIDTPEEFGGAALGPFMNALIQMELGRTWVPFRFGGSADNILFTARGQQVEEYLRPTIEGERRSCFAVTEPDAGSDIASIRTKAVRDGDDWVINGEKIFITNGNDADFVMVFAKTDPAEAEGEIEGPSMTCFLVDRAMGWTSSPIPTMGHWSPASLSFVDVRVPQRNVLGEVGRGYSLAMSWIGKGRYMIPAQAVGIAERLLEMAIEYAKNRSSMGRPIADYQAIQWHIAEAHVALESTRLLTMKAAWQADNSVDARHTSSVAKLQGGLMANDVVDKVLQIHGGMGYTKELPIERWYREVRLLRIFEGTDEIQKRTIARNLLKGHVKVGL